MRNIVLISEDFQKREYETNEINETNEKRVRDQVEGLEDEADRLSTEPREGVFREGIQRLTGDHDVPGGGPVHGPHDVEKGGLAAAAGADDGHHSAFGDVNVDTVERSDGLASLAVDLAHVPQPNQPTIIHSGWPPAVRAARSGGAHRRSRQPRP